MPITILEKKRSPKKEAPIIPRDITPHRPASVESRYRERRFMGRLLRQRPFDSEPFSFVHDSFASAPPCTQGCSSPS